jgi:hypothetical protein
MKILGPILLSLTLQSAHAALGDDLKVLETLNTAPQIESCAQIIPQNNIACADAKAIAQKITATLPLKFNPITLSPSEKKSLSFNQKILKDLNAYLLKYYGYDLSVKGIAWHGRASQQRIIWQDPKVLETLQDPDLIRVMLFQAQNKKEVDLGGGNTLSSVLLYGLASNNFSYLTTVAPNWPDTPVIEGVSWSLLSDMKVPPYKERPLVVDGEYLQQVKKSCESLQSVLTNIYGKPQSKNIEDEAVAKASSAKLLSAINGILSKANFEQVSSLIVGQAGKSTELPRMNGQALEVFTEYDNILKFHQGDHSKVLGYGLVSHALDAKHLSAAIYGILEGQANYRLVVTPDAQNALKKLLKDASENKLGEPGNALMKVRLEQVYTLMLERSEALGLSREEVLKKLSN